MFPISLRLLGRRVLVVGGGLVGRRRAVAASAAGATVTIVDPGERPADFADLRVGWRTEEYQSNHLTGASLVFAAATPEVNARVVADATGQDLWVCDASDPGRGDFTVPAVARRGGLTVAVDTGGAAPHLARALRDRFAADLEDAFAVWVALLAELRDEVQANVPDALARRAVFERLSDWAWLERLRLEDPELVLAAMREVVRFASGGKPQAPPPV